MVIGIVRETGPGERRVALTPTAVRRLVDDGHRVFVEHNAGEDSHFHDTAYTTAGARVAFTPSEVIDRAELLVKVERPAPAEFDMLHAGQAIMAFFHLATATRNTVQALLNRNITTIGFELIETGDGVLPVLVAMSEIAGPMSVAIAAHLLRSSSGGRGVLLGGAPGIAPAKVVILGAGTVGTWAARTAVNAGASTVVFDKDSQQLRRLYHTVQGAMGVLADAETIGEAVSEADVVIGAVLRRGDRAPHLVSRAMVESMRPGAVILDLSIDQGGCVETSRPTTLADPVYIHKGVLHYCVPNMTADIAHTASAVMSQAVLPYIEALAHDGIEDGLSRNPALTRGLYTVRGRCASSPLAERWDLETAVTAQG
jgi:alanine dehydrogenase